MREYFLDDKTDSVTPLVKYISEMGENVSEYVNPDSPFLTGGPDKPYISYLQDTKIPIKGQDPEMVFKEMAARFRGVIRWHYPGSMSNVKSPVNLPALAAGVMAMVYDPNLGLDVNTGFLETAELEVIKYLSELVAWDWKQSMGYFTFGGTSALLNAVKMGINKCLVGVTDNGIRDDLFVISSIQGHSEHADVCNWLGVGKNNCIRIPTDQFGSMDLEIAEKVICEQIEKGKRLACIIACGGTTIQTIVDPIHEIALLRDKIVVKYNLDYVPHLHVDSVIGWAWLFFKEYDFKENKLNLDPVVLQKIKHMLMKEQQIEYADSFGADFHKTGFCPYACCAFVVKDRKQMYDLNKKSIFKYEDLEYGKYSPSTYTLELSRSPMGPISALTTIKCFGVEGFQKLISGMLEGTYYMMEQLNSDPEFEVANSNTEGTCILFIIKPPETCNDISYKDIRNMKYDEAWKLAKYNYFFYLYLLEKIANNELSFFIDYSAGYEKVKKGIQIGTMKAQIFNPFLDKERAIDIVSNIKKEKAQYDRIRDTFYPSKLPYVPKPIKVKVDDVVQKDIKLEYNIKKRLRNGDK